MSRVRGSFYPPPSPNPGLPPLSQQSQRFTRTHTSGVNTAAQPGWAATFMWLEDMNKSSNYPVKNLLSLSLLRPDKTSFAQREVTIYSPTTIRVNSKPFLTDLRWTWFGRLANPTYPGVSGLVNCPCCESSGRKLGLFQNNTERAEAFYILVGS